MAIFRSYKREDAAPAVQPTSTTHIEEPGAPRKKNAPTPSRKQAERERMERLHPTLSAKEQKRLERAERSVARDTAFAKVENAPIRQLCRNYIDAKWHVGEFLMPLMLILLALTIGLSNFPNLFLGLSIVVWVLLGLTIIDVFITWRGFKKLAAERFPNVSTKGLGFYTMNRIIQIRRFRVPPPQIKRGDKF